MLAQIASATGTVTWTNEPESASDWLEFAANDYTPDTVTFPEQSFPEAGSSYAASVLGLVRARGDATFSDGLRSQLSGFTTGSGYASRVDTSP